MPNWKRENAPTMYAPTLAAASAIDTRPGQFLRTIAFIVSCLRASHHGLARLEELRPRRRRRDPNDQHERRSRSTPAL